MKKRYRFKVKRTSIAVVLVLPLMCLLLNFYLLQDAVSQKVFIQTGFEKETVGKPPKDWEVRGEGFEVTTDTVKTDKKALAILLGPNDDRVGVPIETDNPIISIEFWVYIEGGGRSFNLKIITADDIAQHNGGPYINWNGDSVRLFDGAAWVLIDEFDTNEWIYVRVVTDVSKSEFDFYSGEDRNLALKDRGKKGLPFRNPAVNPTAKWVAFHVYSMTAPAYVDDVLIYEGDEPINLAVDPLGKLTTFWGNIKKE